MPLSELQLGERIKKDTINALINDFNKGTVNENIDAGRRVPLNGICVEAVNKYCLFGIDKYTGGGTVDSLNPTVKLVKPSADKIPLVTNSDINIVANQQQAVRLLQPGEVIRLDVPNTDTGFEVGKTVGYKDDSYQCHSDGSNFICLSEPIEYESSKYYIWASMLSGGGGKLLDFYEIQEDDTTARQWLWAVPTLRTGAYPSGSIEGWTKLYKWQNLLSNVKAGYKCKGDLVRGEWCFDQGPCISANCTTGEAISGDQPATNAVVGTSYSFTFTTSGLTAGSLASSGLPPGLTRSGTTISGTPTTAGEYWAIVTGSAVISSSTCSVKRVYKFTVVNP